MGRASGPPDGPPRRRGRPRGEPDLSHGLTRTGRPVRAGDARARAERERARAASDGLGGRRRVLSDTDRRRAVEMATEGVGPTEIARRLGRKATTVAYYLSTQGLTRTRQTDVAETYLHRGQARRRFTREEDAFVEARCVAGDNDREIARACTERFGHPRTSHTVRIRLRNLGSVEEG